MVSRPIRMHALTAAVALLICMADSRAAVAGPSESFARSFANHCVLNIDNLDRIRAASEVLGWPELPEEFQTMLAAPEGDNGMMWAISEDETLYFLAINESVREGRPVNTCALIAENVDRDIVVERLLSQYKMTIVSDEEESFQRYATYQVDYSLGGTLIFVIISSDGPNIVNLAATYFVE